MNRRSIWICDRDTMYLNMLHGYLKERIGLPLMISDFTDVRYMNDKPEHEEILLLIIAEEMLHEIDIDEYADILVLTEGELFSSQESDAGTQSSDRKIHCLSRYSKAAEVLDAVLSILSETKQVRDLCLTKELPVHIIGFYSPLGRCLQTQTALSMGQLLTENHKVLYMNFAPFPEARLVEMGHGETLADLMYYYGCDSSCLAVKWTQVTGLLGGMRVVPPATNYMQIADVTSEEWMGFIREICRASGCEYLILDLSEALPCLFDVLSICERIYTICGHDRSDAAKIESYRNFLNVYEQSNLANRTVFMSLPTKIDTPRRYSDFGESTIGRFIVESNLLPKGAVKSRVVTKKYFGDETDEEVEDVFDSNETERVKRRKVCNRKRVLFKKR